MISVLDTVYNNLEVLRKKVIKVERDWVVQRLAICDGVPWTVRPGQASVGGGSGTKKKWGHSGGEIGFTANSIFNVTDANTFSLFYMMNQEAGKFK